MGGGDDKIEAQKYSMVVCQADKRVICAGRKKADGGAGKEVEQSECAQEKKVEPVALCSFSVALWNLGGTCIANHLYGDEHPQCHTLAQESLDNKQSAKQDILKGCRKATEFDADQCEKKPDLDNCKKAALERDYCTRLAMSF